MSTASKVAARKAAHPELYCPKPRCLWFTNGGPCPRHNNRDESMYTWARRYDDLNGAPESDEDR